MLTRGLPKLQCENASESVQKLIEKYNLKLEDISNKLPDAQKYGIKTPAVSALVNQSKQIYRNATSARIMSETIFKLISNTLQTYLHNNPHCKSLESLIHETFKAEHLEYIGVIELKPPPQKHDAYDEEECEEECEEESKNNSNTYSDDSEYSEFEDIALGCLLI